MSLTEELLDLDELEALPEGESSPSLWRLTQAAYPWPKWALVPEVPSEPGFYARRRIDAMALAMWQSDHHRLIAFEFKVSRSDWLRELKQPEKCLEALKLADEFHLVTLPGVAKAQEIPHGWGWLEANEALTRLERRKRAQLTPKGDFSRGLTALLVRRASEVLERERKSEFWKTRKDCWAQIHAEIAAGFGPQYQREQEELQRRRETDHAVFQALGMSAETLAERGEEFIHTLRDTLAVADLVKPRWKGFGK